MKNFLIFFLILGFEGFSQNLTNPEEEKIVFENREFGNFIDLESPAITSQNPKIKSELSIGNQIFIEQIGTQNNISATASSRNSDLRLLQYGNGNYISFITEAQDLDGTILQEGNSNNAFDFTVNPNQDISANLLQKGDNLHFERYGANSIGNNLKIIQTGDTKSIIVRNFQ